MPVRTGVIGLGVMGAEHARLLSGVVSGSELAAVFDIDRPRAEQAAAFGGARVLDDPMVLIKDDDVDAVLIASVDASHEQFVLACIAAGKPVLCEKPLAPDVAACVRVLAAEADADHRLLSVGFMRRYDPGYLDMRAALRGGQLGRPLMLHCVHRNATAPDELPSEMLLAGSAVHEIDIARWLLDDELVSVTVHTPRRSALAGGTQDPLLLVLQSASGVLVDVEVFVHARYGYEVRCELVAELGTVSVDPVPPTMLRTAAGRSRGVPADWRARFDEAYRRELQEWIDGIAAGDPARGPSAWDGYVATEVAEAGIRALHSGVPQAVTLRDKPAIYG